MAAGIGESGMNLIAGALGLLGKKPTVPPAPNVDIGTSQGKAIRSDLASMPDLATLTSKVNELSIDELMKNMEKFMPGYGKLLSQGTSDIASQLRGELPADVISQIKRSSAEKATSGGYEGSSVQSNLSARDLGLTSLNLIQRGLSSAESWMAMANKAAPQFDFTRMFISPAQQIAGDQWNEVMRFNRDWMGNQIAAMPSPMEQAEAGALQSFGAMVDTYGSMALGGMGGGVGAAFGGGAMASRSSGGGGYGGGMARE